MTSPFPSLSPDLLCDWFCPGCSTYKDFVVVSGGISCSSVVLWCRDQKCQTGAMVTFIWAFSLFIAIVLLVPFYFSSGLVISDSWSCSYSCYSTGLHHDLFGLQKLIHNSSRKFKRNECLIMRVFKFDKNTATFYSRFLQKNNGISND